MGCSVASPFSLLFGACLFLFSACAFLFSPYPFLFSAYLLLVGAFTASGDNLSAQIAPPQPLIALTLKHICPQS